MADLFQPKFVDLVRNTTTTQGTDDFALGSAVSGFSGFSDGCAVGDRFYYAAVGLDNPAEREVGRGTLLDGGVIAREPVSGTKTEFTSGTKSISLVAASEWFSEVSAVRAAGGPTSVKSFGAMGDSDELGTTGTDDTAAIQAALDHIDSIGGGTVYFPEGHYRITSCLTLHPRTTIRGAGKAASVIVSAHGGGAGATAGETMAQDSGLRTNSPLNSSTSIYVTVQDISIKNVNGANVGAAYYDTCGTNIVVQNATLVGFKYGIVLDQSELVDIDFCEIGAQNSGGAAIWIVNGADLTPGALNGFSNRISVKRSQINQSGGAYGIVDDGGYCHAFEDNNYNGCVNHIHAAGVASLAIRGGEYESAIGDCIVLSSVTPGGATVGGCIAAIRGGAFNVQSGYAAIAGTGAPGVLQVDGNAHFAGGGGTPPITGAYLFAGLWLLSYSNQSGSPAAVKDGAGQYVDLDLNAGGGMAFSTPFAVNGVSFSGGAVTASNIGTAAAREASDFLAAPGTLADRIAVAKQLGSPVMLAQSAVAVSHGGDTNEAVLASVAVPANSMGVNGRVEVEARLTLSNSANSKTVNLKFGGTTFATKVQAGAAIDSLQGDIANRGDPAIQVGSAQFYTGNSMSTNGVTTGAADTSQEQILSITAQLASAADTVTLESYRFVLHPAD